MVVGMRQTINAIMGGQRQLNAAVDADGVEGDNHNQKDDGQGNQKGGQGNFVESLFSGRRLPPERSYDPESCAGIGGNLDFQPVRHHRGPAGPPSRSHRRFRARQGQIHQ